MAVDELEELEKIVYKLEDEYQQVYFQRSAGIKNGTIFGPDEEVKSRLRTLELKKANAWDSLRRAVCAAKGEFTRSPFTFRKRLPYGKK